MSGLIYGIHAVSNLLKANQATEIFVLDKGSIGQQLQKVITVAESNNIKVNRINNVKQLPQKIAKEARHQNIFAIEKASNDKLYNEKDLANLIPDDKKAFILVLDSVQDPHNFGACIRTAHSAGVDFIVIPKDNSVAVNATVKKVACGAAEHTKVVVVTNLARAIEKLKEQGVWVIGLAGEADDNLYSMDLCDNIALVAGSEGAGMRQKTKQICDFLVKLPMHGKVSSLNVSVAAGISMYEVVRQRSSR